MNGEAGITGGVAVFGVGRDGGGFARGGGGEGESCFGSQGVEDGGELVRGGSSTFVNAVRAASTSR
jgi:hypothetical protein